MEEPGLNLIPAVLVAFTVSVVFTAILKPIAESVGLVDMPGGRKTHAGEIPIVGGIAMFVGIFSALILVRSSIYPLIPLFVASLLILFVGTLDDRFHLAPAVRLSAQLAAVLLMFFGAGLTLAGIGDPFGSGEIGMGRFTLLFTMLVTLTMINAYNLIDGIDGLAGSLSVVALLSVAAVAGIDHASGVIALTVSSAVGGFLIFNFPTKWNRNLLTFMGDAGSTLLGFTIVWITLGICQGPDRLISPVHCLWFASIPIYDALTCFVRRALKGKSPFAPGRDHFHHTLRRGGFGVRETLGVLTALQAIYALAALVAHFAGVADVVMFTAWSIFGLTQRFVIKFLARHRRAFQLRRRRAH